MSLHSKALIKKFYYWKKLLQILSQTPRDPLFFQNPFIFYKKLRAVGKIVRWDDYNMAVTTDYTTVSDILRNKKFVREPPGGFFTGIPKHLLPFYENESRSMLEREPPYHTKLKSLVSPFFTKNKLYKLETEINQLCNNLLQEIPNSEFDLTTDFSKKFPVLVITQILGVPKSMAPYLINWSSDMVAMYQARKNEKIEKKAVSATKDFCVYVKSLLREKENKPSEDLISYLIHSQRSKKTVSEEEIISTIILLLNAGHEATVHTISNGLKAILESEFSPLKLIENPKKLTEEVLRYATPLHMFTRYFTTDVSLFGHNFKSGDKIGLLLGAANRDPNHFDFPENFNPFITRKTNLSLGAGLHFCLGAHLARLELEIAFTNIIKKFPKITIAAKPTYSDTYHFYRLNELIVKT